MMDALTSEIKARFDRAMEQDEACRLRQSYEKRLAAALAARGESGIEPWNRSAEMAYLDDHGFIEPAAVGLELSDSDRRFAYSAEGHYLKLAKDRTGETLPDEKLSEMRKDNATLADQTRTLAERMGAAGFNCYRDTPFRLVRYFIHSEHEEMLPGYRRVTFLPSVAQGLRAPMLAALESYIERNPFCRMWTMTSGPKTKLQDIRERARWMHGKLSDLNATPFMRDAGCEIVFRSTELGTPETDAAGNMVAGGEIETDESGQMWFHVHAHCVVALKHGFIAPKKWARLISQVGEFWRGTDGKKAWWKDGSEGKSGRIVEPREVCKYVTKPAEMLKLSGEQLVALQEQLCRLKLVHPMGQLAEEIKARKAKRLRLFRHRTPDGAVYREGPDHNKHRQRTRTEKLQDYVAKLDTPDNGADKLRVVSRSMPVFGPCGVSEPSVVVMFTGRWNPAAVRAHCMVAPLIAATADEFAAGRAIRVHTCTPTVLETAAFPFVLDLPPPRISLTGAELAGYSR